MKVPLGFVEEVIQENDDEHDDYPLELGHSSPNWMISILIPYSVINSISLILQTQIPCYTFEQLVIVVCKIWRSAILVKST